MNLLGALAVVVGVLIWAGRRPGRAGGALRGFRSVADWFGARTDGGAEHTPSVGEPGDKEARDILGVDAGADRAAIEAAYRRLIRRIHPDHGGTAGLAARLNAARDRLQRKDRSRG